MTGATEPQRNWQSVRTLLEALILASLLWSAKTQVALLTQIAVLQDNVSSLRVQLSDVPGLATRVTRLEMQVEADRQTIADLKTRVNR